MVEEMPGSVTNNIKTNFLLSDDLARKYAAIVFIACLRFETTKRKLQYLNFSDFFECSQVMIYCLTSDIEMIGTTFPVFEFLIVEFNFLKICRCNSLLSSPDYSKKPFKRERESTCFVILKICSSRQKGN